MFIVETLYYLFYNKTLGLGFNIPLEVNKL